MLQYKKRSVVVEDSVAYILLIYWTNGKMVNEFLNLLFNSKNNAFPMPLLALNPTVQIHYPTSGFIWNWLGYFGLVKPRCIKLGRETDSATRWRNRTGETSPRGSWLRTFLKLSFNMPSTCICCKFNGYNRKLFVKKPIRFFFKILLQMVIKNGKPDTKVNKRI